MAAAFAALVSVQNDLDLIYNDPSHSFSFDEEQIESLRKSVDFLIDFTESYDNSHGDRKEGAEALEGRIARAAQAAKYVIETHVVDQIRGGKTRSKARSRRFLLDVQKVIEDMDYMRRKAMNINVKAQSSGMEGEQQQPTYSASHLTSNKTTKMVGFDDVLDQLLDKLTGDSSRRQVIPIVGMGGIGKTTLAKNAFQHPLIVERFDVCLWATISQQYSVDKIISELACELRKSTSCGTVHDEEEEVYKSLCGRRYLVVLDDMWSVEVWDKIRSLFPEENGSRVVVTTRHSDVANQLGGISRIAMSFLDEDNSWDLFCQNAFAEQAGCPPELEEIGKKIVEKCGGLPLAIVVVGGHLRKSSMAPPYWENVASHMSSILNSTDKDEQCLTVLALSYSYLPARLKPCFLLLGSFQEDEVISAEDVRNLWIAEGIIQSFENTRLEVVVEDYLRNLFERNLILGDQLDYDDKIVRFKLHDLVREVCLKISQKEEFLHVFDTLPPAISRLSSDLKLSRILNKVDASSISESILQQVNVRYLNIDFRYTARRFAYFPSSISLLWNLQILKIVVPHPSTLIAPYEIWDMLQLRHLEVVQICLPDPLPVDRLDGKANEDDLILRNLHTLAEVVNFRLSEEVCKRIPNIIVLELSYCDEALMSYYCPHNLGCFLKLEHLACKFDSSNSKWDVFALSLTFPSSALW